MQPNDRFYPCESLGFPEVSQYDYESNIPTRGINDTSFRWEEVAVRSVYLMQEATVSGSFEYTTFLSDFSISNPTGVNYVSTTGANLTSYAGWIITGNSTVFIGTSGLYVNSGDLPSVTGSFYAHPIVGNYALGLYSISGEADPGIISVSLATGEEGPVIPSNTHQLYLKAKLNYGESGSLQALVRGYSAGTLVAIYDPFSGAWGTSVPSQSYPVASSGYTTIKYQFSASSYPGASPTSFDVYIYNETSGSFITIDDIHLDVLMKKNAFLDYIVPTGYMVQITPDLGWHDTLSMFEASEKLTNPHLKTLGPYQIDLGNLTDNLDNTVTATVDQKDFRDATSTNYKKYLWRALPISPNGQLGPGGLPDRFEYVGDVVDSLFKVTDIVDNEVTTVKTIIGTKSSSMCLVVDGIENFPGLVYPTATSWKITISVDTATRTLSIKAVDSSGTTSSIRYVTLTNKLYQQNTIALWNVFDEHGLIADVERLNEESNYDYSLRIKDAYKNKSSPDFVGIVNGASRELNLKKVENALIVTILSDQNKIYKAQQFDFEVTSYSVRLYNDMFTTTERLYVDPVYNTVNLTYLPKDLPLSVKSDVSSDIALSKIKYIYTEDNTKVVYQAKVSCKNSTYIDITYRYYQEAFFKQHTTIQSIVDFINSIRDPSGQQVLQASISSLLSGNEVSLGLYISYGVVNTKEGAAVSWSPFILKKLTDIGYKDIFLTDSPTLKSSDYYAYVSELKNNTKIFWGAVEADRDRWDAADSKSLGMESIPTLFDPPISNMSLVISGQSVKINSIEAWAKGYKGLDNETISNYGLSPEMFHPGVGYINDLEPSIFLTTSKETSKNSLSSNIGPVKNLNEFIIFSGQR